MTSLINGKKVLAIIPARGGSKGIPKKNIIKVDGKPLIQYTIDAAKGSKYIDEIHVSTDDCEIANVVNALGIQVPRLRPSELAQDESKTIDVMLDVFHFYKIQENYFDVVVLLQPTQPLRKAYHIDEALEVYIKHDEESVVSVSLVEEHPILMREIDENSRLKPLLNESSTVRRQDFKPYYIVNGAIYVNKVSELTVSTSLNDNIQSYIMNRRYHVDIDTYEDLKIFELLLKKKANDR